VPTNINTEVNYYFWIHVTTSSGYQFYTSQYSLDVGCTQTSVDFTADASFTTTGVRRKVGDPVGDEYTYHNPSWTLSYC